MLANIHTGYVMDGQTKDQTLLPIMTALFVDGLEPNHRQVAQRLEGLNKAIQAKRHGKICRLPQYPERRSQAPEILELKNGMDSDTRSIPGMSLSNRRGGPSSVRRLITGISHHFNNIMIGIWGNITLIRSDLDQTEPAFAHAILLEKLIGNGIFLINTVLGCLAERRYSIRKNLLKQLIQEIQGDQDDIEFLRDDLLDLEKRMQSAFQIHQPRMISSSTARVLDAILEGIDSYHKDLVLEKSNDKIVLERLDKIKALVCSGFEMTHQLHLYAGDIEYDVQRVKLAPLVRRVVQQVEASEKKAILINVDISKKLKSIEGDRKMIMWALKQVLSNACIATPEKGSINIAVRPLNEEPTMDRCCVQKGSDYMVISVMDNGQGIPGEVKRHVFDPYFTYPKTHNRIGLGLSAASGILKAHCGYIQMRSQEKGGSTFKMFLPTAGTALQGWKMKYHFKKT